MFRSSIVVRSATIINLFTEKHAPSSKALTVCEHLLTPSDISSAPLSYTFHLVGLCFRFVRRAPCTTSNAAFTATFNIPALLTLVHFWARREHGSGLRWVI